MRKRDSIILSIAATISTLLIIILLSVNIYQTTQNEIIGTWYLAFYVIIFCTSFLIYGLITFFVLKGKYQKTADLINSINSMETSQEELLEVGSIIYNESEIIIFITPWLQREGMSSFLGKKVSSLKIDMNNQDKQEMNFDSHKWEVSVLKKSRIILFKEISRIFSLKSIINDQIAGVVSIQTFFANKLNFNDSIKSEAILKINNGIRKWVNEKDGVINTSLNNDGIVSAIFCWRKGEEDILTRNLLKELKRENKILNKNITISIGVSFGETDYRNLLDNSYKALEISKSRGGDQIALIKPNGDVEYIGVSKKQSVGGSVINIKNFYTELIAEIRTSKEVFITSHSNADLDAIGSVLGTKLFINEISTNTWIILNKFDETAQKLYKTLPKQIKSWFITEDEAKEKITNRSLLVITDTSNPYATQMPKLVDNFSKRKIQIIDHHRISKEAPDFKESKKLIDPSISSTSELIVEMLKLSYGEDPQEEIDEPIATALLAGIRLDTKQFLKNVSTRTLDAISFLMKNDANILRIEKLFKQSQKLIEIEAKAMSNILKPIKDVLFTYIDQETRINDEQTSIIADKFLNYEGIEATFVLGYLENEKKYKLSARSNSKFNVQSVVEQLGGGGHLNSAACTWNSEITDFQEIKNKIVEVIKNYG